MPAFICSACGTQYPPSEAPPAHCPVREDERQFIPPEGQSWTTLERLRISHHNGFRQYEPGLIGIGTQPKFAIGQRALLLCTPEGNILWDCISLIDDSTTPSRFRIRTSTRRWSTGAVRSGRNPNNCGSGPSHRWRRCMLVTSVSVVQRWNQAVAVATAPETRPPRSTPRLPVERTSSARWLNTAPSRRAAGFRRYNAPYAYPELTRTTAICAILEPKTKRRREQLSDAELIHLAPGRNQTDGAPTP
jgi:hypothetical protein